MPSSANTFITKRYHFVAFPDTFVLTLYRYGVKAKGYMTSPYVITSISQHFRIKTVVGKSNTVVFDYRQPLLSHTPSEIAYRQLPFTR